MTPAVYLSHPSSLLHDTGQHPERAERITAIETELERHDWFGMERVEAPPVDAETLAAVHPVRYTRGIEELCAAGGGAIDADTVVVEASYEAALRGAGGAARMVDLLMSGEARTGFSALRPPGHHAEAARAMGFCLFNNVAVAAQRALDAHGAGRVLVLDWDVHHGNGTNDVFHASDEVLFVSIHESPLYPGSGPAGDVGRGAGTGCTVNLPVSAGTGDATYASLVEHVVAPLARAYEPRLILVSAGFDAHREDPLAGIALSEAGFAAMTGTVRRVGAELGVPVGGVLEGGYALGALARSTAATLEVLTAAEPPAAVADLPVAPETSAALERLAERWPTLAARAR
jgi:acetoin utilization deacetylase AcuC-like enzyme